LQERDALAYVAAVEGSSSLDNVISALRKRKVKKVFLVPPFSESQK
jgi:cobalamin biosynthesis Co2+ chelatase CbiK